MRFLVFCSIIPLRGGNVKYLFYRLIIFLDTANENDTNYNIAWYMANNFKKVAKMGISELAKACFVSPATISRFCRALGYDNFAHLKQECGLFMKNLVRSNNLANISDKLILDDPKAATIDYTNRMAEQVNNISKYLDWREVDACLALIHDMETVAFFGTQFSHSAALNFQTDLMMLDKFSIAYMDTDRQLECAKKLDKNSVAIIISVYGNYLGTGSKALSFIKKSGAKTVLITQNEKIPLVKEVDHVILLGDHDHTKFGKHTLLTAMELMSCRYFALYSHENKQG